MNFEMKAMILAAGRGERMRPLTDNLPKPLIEVGGKPLIVWHIEKLVAAGFKFVVINISWMGDKLKQKLGDGSAWGIHIEYSVEKEALETAGGIIKALPFFEGNPFAVINGDIWSEFSSDNFQKSFKKLSDSKFLAKLFLVINPEHNLNGDFSISEGVLKPFCNQKNIKHWTYSGIGFYKPEFFNNLNAGKRALPPLWAAAATKEKISAELFEGYWKDIGTPKRLAEIESYLLHKNFVEELK